jgi:hypothetical protein
MNKRIIEILISEASDRDKIQRLKRFFDKEIKEFEKEREERNSYPILIENFDPTGIFD